MGNDKNWQRSGRRHDRRRVPICSPKSDNSTMTSTRRTASWRRPMLIFRWLFCDFSIKNWNFRNSKKNWKHCVRNRNRCRRTAWTGNTPGNSSIHSARGWIWTSCWSWGNDCSNGRRNCKGCGHLCSNRRTEAQRSGKRGGGRDAYFKDRPKKINGISLYSFRLTPHPPPSGSAISPLGSAAQATIWTLLNPRKLNICAMCCTGTWSSARRWAEKVWWVVVPNSLK